MIEIRPHTAHFSLGFVLSRFFWGQHLMSEALRATLHVFFSNDAFASASALCHPANERSKQLLLRNHFSLIEERAACLPVPNFSSHLEDALLFSLTKSRFLSIVEPP
jgi:RimJ/RimL family protein N-acetyltransferase